MKPADILPDSQNSKDFEGMNIRKGSVAAFLANADIILSSEFSTEEKIQAQNDIVELVPALRKLGLFRVLEIKDPILRQLVNSVPDLLT